MDRYADMDGNREQWGDIELLDLYGQAKLESKPIGADASSSQQHDRCSAQFY